MNFFMFMPSGNFVNAGLVDVAGDAKQPRAAVFRRAATWRTILRRVRRMMAGTATERFHIVDNGRAAVEADNGREGRLDARIAALAFERFHQRGFFAAFVCARAGVSEQVEIEADAENVFAQVAAR